jgi:Protein of unknown function (DUF3054)
VLRRVAPLIDLAGVIIFVAIGRSQHHHGDAWRGLVSTTWPFALGLAVAWIVTALRSHTGLSLVDGALIVVVTVGVGMVARVIGGQGTAAAFVVVALVFVGLVMEGWRAAWAWRRSSRTG